MGDIWLPDKRLNRTEHLHRHIMPTGPVKVKKNRITDSFHDMWFFGINHPNSLIRHTKITPIEFGGLELVHGSDYIQTDFSGRSGRAQFSVEVNPVKFQTEITGVTIIVKVLHVFPVPSRNATRLFSFGVSNGAITGSYPITQPQDLTVFADEGDPATKSITNTTELKRNNLFVCVTHDGESFKYYENGVLIEAVADAGFDLSTLNSDVAYFGGFGSAILRADYQYFMLGNRALSAPEIKKIYDDEFNVLVEPA